MKFLSMLVLAIAAFAVSCERHDFDDPEYGTKQLHHDPKAHGGHGDHGDHHDDHKEEGHEKAGH